MFLDNIQPAILDQLSDTLKLKLKANIIKIRMKVYISVYWLSHVTNLAVLDNGRAWQVSETFFWDTKVKVLPIVAENMFVVAVVAAVVGRCHYWLCTVVVSRRWSVWDWCGHSGGALIYSNNSSAHTTTTTPQQQLRPATTRLYNPHFPITGIYKYSLPVSST